MPSPLGEPSPTDNAWFTLPTQNTAPVHLDRHYAAQTEFGRPLVDSTFTVALVTGQSVTDVSQNVVANLGRDGVLETRPSRSRPNAGIVTLKTTGFNQDGTVVGTA